MIPEPAVKFDGAFLDRRMREHRRWQDTVAEQLCRDVLDDLAIARPLDQPALEFPKPARRRQYALGT